GIEEDHRDQQQAIAHYHAQVLHAASHHDAQQVGGEGNIGRFTIAKRVREDDVGQKHRRESQHACQKVPEKGVTQQQRIGRQEDIQQQHPEQQQVKQANALELEAPVDQDGQQRSEERRVGKE